MRDGALGRPAPPARPSDCGRSLAEAGCQCRAAARLPRAGLGAQVRSTHLYAASRSRRRSGTPATPASGSATNRSDGGGRPAWRQGGFRALINRLVSCNSTLLVLVSSVPADVRVRPGSALHCETGPAGRRTASNEWGTGRVARACLRGSWFGRNWNLFHSMSQGPNSFTLLRGRGSESAGTIPQLTPSAAEISDAAPSLKSEASPQLTPSGRCCSSAEPVARGSVTPPFGGTPGLVLPGSSISAPMLELREIPDLF